MFGKTETRGDGVLQVLSGGALLFAAYLFLQAGFSADHKMIERLPAAGALVALTASFYSLVNGTSILVGGQPSRTGGI